MIRSKFWVPIITLGLLLGGQTAKSAGFPDHPIRFLIGFAPGGGTDVLARLIAQHLTEKWGQSVIVENRPGADGTIAEDVLVHSPSDGYTIMMTNNNLTVTPSEHKLGFDPAKDFTAVVLAARAPDVLVTNPASLKIDSVKELIALAKAKPGQLNYGSTGIGGPPYLEMELLKKIAGVNISHIPYQGSAPATVALLSGEIQMTFSSIQGSLANIKAGKFKALAVSTSFRSPTIPDVPTVAESGDLPTYDGGGSWYGVIAPANVPQDVLTKLHDDIVTIIKSPDVQKTFSEQGFLTVANTPQDFAQFIKQDIPKWSEFFKDAPAK